MNIRAGSDSTTVDATVDRALFPNCRQAYNFTVDSEEKNTLRKDYLCA